MPQGNPIQKLDDPRSTAPSRWITLLSQLLNNPPLLDLDDTRIAPLDQLIRCVDHFVFTLTRYKRIYRDKIGNPASHDLIFRVLITALRESVNAQPSYRGKSYFFELFHETLTRSHFTLE